MPEEEPGVDAWADHASAFDRVRAVAGAVTRPRSVPWIAERAAVSENTTRDHLERLVEMNVLVAREDAATTTYEPDPLHTRLQSVRDLLERYDHDGLLEVKAEFQERIEDWQDEFEAGSPSELRELAADSRRAAETDAIREAANEWELARYRLAVVEDAIEHYDAYAGRDPASA